MDINWTAVDRAIKHFRVDAHGDYRTWILAEAGIDHCAGYIRIANMERYMMFLLRWG